MTFLTELWLAILLSAVFVFIVSSVIHMALPIHKGDYRKMNNEDAVLEATTAKFIIDGVIYGLVTAGTFGWLWPSAA